MTEQNWTEQEKQELGATTESVFEKLPALKLEENKITEVTIDFSEKFKTFDTTDMKGQPVQKAIMPVTSNGVKMNWWINKKNPIYKELLSLAKDQNTLTVKVMQTGIKQNTKYILVK